MTSTLCEHYSATEQWPAVKERTERILRLLTGTREMGIAPNPTAVPDWYPPGLDTGASVQLDGTGLHVTASCIRHSHNGFAPVTRPAPSDPIEYNLLRLKRHRILRDIAVRSLESLDAHTRPRPGAWVLASAPFVWDVRHHGAAPLDGHGTLVVPEAKRKLEMILDFHGDMAFALDAYLRARGTDPDRITIGA